MPEESPTRNALALPGWLTADRIRSIQAKPQSEWTDDEIEYMRRGHEWVQNVEEVVASTIRALTGRLKPAVTIATQWEPDPRYRQAIRALGDEIHRLADEVYSAPVILDEDEFVSPDQYRHVPGLPGISERCWADVWIPDPLCVGADCPDLDEHGSYQPCGAEATSIVGTCAEHKL